MAQREMEETELQVSDTLTLCVNNCGLPGNPATKNMCQICFQAAGFSSPPSRSGHEKPRSAAIRPVKLPETGRDRVSEAAEESVTVASSRQVNRCSGCRRRVGLTGFRCRCGELFCSEHRYSDRHVCSYDYKAAGREAIARENPVVRAAKIVRV